jgi:raffinose/stachyose/melibiose transport system permease protein
MQAVGQRSSQRRDTPGPQTHASQLRRRLLSKWLIISICLLPALVIFSVFVLLPVVEAAFYSLYNWNGLGPLQNFTGLQNYVELLEDPVFLNAVKTNLLIALLSLVFQLPLALFLALLVKQRGAGSTFFRTVFFLPYILSEVVAGLIWAFIYDPSIGPLDAFFKLINPSGTPPAFLADTHTVLLAVFVVMLWKYFGFHLVLYLAGLQNIPQELPEAARTDGANRWQVTRYITLPMLSSTIRLTVFLSILGSLQYFDLIFVMTDGGPVHATETMATYLIHKGFQSFLLGYGSAVGVVMFIFCFGFALVYQRWVMRQDLTGVSQ